MNKTAPAALKNPTFAQKVAMMNIAFNNPKGDPKHINWGVIESQSKSVLDEVGELFVGLGYKKSVIDALVHGFKSALTGCEKEAPDLNKVRDANVDICVFAAGSHHLMGVDFDRDGDTVIEGVLTRFVKNAEDLEATLAKHAAAGVTDVTVEGVFPLAIVRSNSDQPDAPKGKFLKSASTTFPTFYEV